MLMKQIAEAFLKRHRMHPDGIDMRECCNIFMEEMRKGLSGEDSSLMMLPTYISLEQPVLSGKRSVILDAGGTNLRMGIAEFRDGDVVFHRLSAQPVPGSIEPVTREEFVNSLSDWIAPLFDGTDRFGFCFSFPSEATPDLDGVVVEFNKEVRVERASGMHVCREICDCLDRRGVCGVRYALINDTVATLLGGYGLSCGMQYDGYIGFVLGTGTNCSYLERAGRIKKLDGLRKQNMVINMEAGGYGCFPQGDFDVTLDQSTANPGAHLYEKMVSGGYLGTLAAEMLRLADQEDMIHIQAPLEALDAVDMKAISEYLTDPAADSKLGRLVDAGSDGDTLFSLLDLLLDRAAKMVAVNLVAILVAGDMGKSAEHPACIIAEGSTFEKSEVYQSKIRRYTKELAAEYGRHFVLCSYDDVNLIGAATAAWLL